MNTFKIMEQKDLEVVNEKLAKKLDDEITNGQEIAEDGRNDEAIKIFLTAWKELPEPKLGWELYTCWIASAVFDAYMELSKYDEAKHWAQITLDARSADYSSEGFINLGKVSLELNELDAAFKWFDLAFELGKKRAFQGEKPKYLNFYLTEKAKR
jgi:tetratricopeptide (TPR) repeat protein